MHCSTSIITNKRQLLIKQELICVQAQCHGGAFRGRALPNHCLCPPNKNCTPSEDCDPKKVTGSVSLECSSRPETLKILIITREFVSKNRFVVDSAVKIFFIYLSFGLHTRIREQEPILRGFCGEALFSLHTLEFRESKFLCPPKIVWAPPPPPPPVTLLWRRDCLCPLILQ